MSDSPNSSTSKQPADFLTWALSLVLVAMTAALAVFVWQQSTNRAAQEQIAQLGVELTEAQLNSQRQELLATTLEAQKTNLTAELLLATEVVLTLQLQTTPGPTPEPLVIFQRVAGQPSLPYCFLGASNEDFQAEFTAHVRVRDGRIEQFFSDPLVTGTWEHGTLYQMCYTDRHEIGFVVYGEFAGHEGANNLIGIYNGEELIADYLFNPSSGDIGLCLVQGYIEHNLVFSCGGGDGPGGWNTVYVLNRETGQSTIIKKCTFFEEQTDCDINLLDLG